VSAGGQRLRTFASLFLAAEAVGGLVFWLLLLFWPALLHELAPPGVGPEILRGLAFADLPLLVGAAAVASWGLARHRFWARSVLYVHAGAMAYAGLAGWGLVWATQGPLWPGLIGTPSMILPFWLAVTLRPERPR